MHTSVHDGEDLEPQYPVRTRTAGAPRIAGTALAVPPHRYPQAEITEAFADVCLEELPVARRMLAQISRNAGVGMRNMALPLEKYLDLAGFTEANQAWQTIALDLGEQAFREALQAAGVAPEEVDLVVSTTVTGLAVPSLEARLAGRLGLREDVKRLPLFGLGCAAGAAGVARLHDHLRAYPDQVAVLLAVELCSLTVQRGDPAPANLVAISLFGDGAAAVVATGAEREPQRPGPAVLAARSRLYPGTSSVMGWEIGTTGFEFVLSPDVAALAERELPADVEGFLAEHGLRTTDVAAWVCHPGGPKVIEAVERGLGLPADALANTRRSLADQGNLSSVSVLDVLRRTLAEPPPPGATGLLTAMGPGFASELVLLRW
ncbi:type III polyketide synthase [Streptomyces sp. CA-250714]|uniref:type III polyketide synthase n=1 Tax=Streptomyces sp. CA-250714 TaxID=3240060 RepID=UPI003D8AC405